LSFTITDHLDSGSGVESGPSHEEIKAFLDAEFEHEMNTWLDNQVADTEPIVAQAPTSLAATQATTVDSVMSPGIQQEDPIASSQVEQTPSEFISNTELARVAQQLVNSVSDNTSEKFKKSTFMGLIGRIAAGDIVVANNDFVESPQAASAQARGPAQHYPGLPADSSEVYSYSFSEARL
jgi:hypothetical protein